jgi:hypothetical protein
LVCFIESRADVIKHERDRVAAVLLRESASVRHEQRFETVVVLGTQLKPGVRTLIR